MLTALDRHHEPACHVCGALTNGVTQEQIQEVLLQAIAGCGATEAPESFRVAEHAITLNNSETTGR